MWAPTSWLLGRFSAAGEVRDVISLRNDALIGRATMSHLLVDLLQIRRL